MSTSENTTWRAPQSKGAFGGFIGPANLVELVRTSAPWLFDGSHPRAGELPQTHGARVVDDAAHALGWWTILLHAERVPATVAPTSPQITDYFALCLACHVASVATYVPTDVDAKIRRALWLDQRDPGELERMFEMALALERWDPSPVSARIVDVVGVGPLSGHDGERLSVLCGAWIGAWNVANAARCEQFEVAIDAELAREARAFDVLAARRGSELDLLRAAAVLTHNAGDVMQSLGSKHAACVPQERRARFADLARERFERYGGAFGRAATLYRELLAQEGHRNYPLREVKALRKHPDLLLPIAPFLDAWGESLARWPAFTHAERASVVCGLVDGCRRVDGQEAYYRALVGFERAYPNGLEARELVEHYGSSVKHELKSTPMRKKLTIARTSFEGSYGKRARALLGI